MLTLSLVGEGLDGSYHFGANCAGNHRVIARPPNFEVEYELTMTRTKSIHPLEQHESFCHPERKDNRFLCSGRPIVLQKLLSEALSKSKLIPPTPTGLY